MPTTAKKRPQAAAPAAVDIRAWPHMLDRLHEGDCVAGMRAMPDGCVDCIVADPPFNIGREYPDHDDQQSTAAYLAWCVEWLEQCVRVLKKTGSLWIFSSEEHVSELKVLAEGRYGLALDDAVQLRRGGRILKPRHHVIWYYTFGVNCPRKLTRSHTHMLHLVRSTKHHAWYPDAVRLPSARQEVYGDKRANPDGRLPDDTWIIRPIDPRAGFDEPGDVVHVPRICGTHKQKSATDNQTPEQLIGRVLRLCTAPGDLVLSPFAGSGTDLAVAKKLGRRHVGFDVSAGYVLQAKLRLEAAQAGEPLDGPIG